jgi:hypothetical protein
MRVRIGRSLRLVLIFVCLVVFIPLYFLRKLESIDRQAEANDIGIEINDQPLIRRAPVTNFSLQPIMGSGKGNYEPIDLPVRSGPGEGGQRIRPIDSMFIAR